MIERLLKFKAFIDAAVAETARVDKERREDADDLEKQLSTINEKLDRLAEARR
jgi:uncharacterized protein YlxW (UPF0749 family)